MSIEYAHALITAEKFTAELEKLGGEERRHVLNEFLACLPFCRHCGYTGCRGECENDE